MENNYGQQGWKEFHRNRKDILSEYDKILEQIENRPIRTAHGIGVEAYIRKWLAEFLPKKFGVTSGYIIPNLYDDSGKIYHFDIIIYDRLDSPILWVEGNEDSNAQGKYRAIPAKYVLAVYEVKSRLNKINVVESHEKLNQTASFKNQLHPLYHCGTIFIDLKETDNNNENIIKELFKGSKVYGFIGGIVLRYVGDKTIAGMIEFRKLDKKKAASDNEKKIKLKPLAKPIDDLNIYFTEEDNITIDEQGAGIKLVKTTENNWSFSKIYGVIYEKDNLSINLSWSRSRFADFCIQLLSSLEGLSLDDENRPSFGQIFDTAKRKEASLQAEKRENGKPFVSLKIYDGESLDKQPKMHQEGKNMKISFWLVVENHGDFEVVLSDDLFKNKLDLPIGKYGMKMVTYQIEFHEEIANFENVLQKDITIPYRLVYYIEVANSSKEFFAIEKLVRYQNGKWQFED